MSFVVVHVLHQERHVEGAKRWMAARPPPLLGRQGVEPVGKDAALGQERRHRVLARVRRDELGKSRVVLGRVGLEPRRVPFEHGGDAPVKEVLDAQQMAHQLSDGPSFGRAHARKRLVVYAGGDAPDIVSILAKPRRESRSHVGDAYTSPTYPRVAWTQSGTNATTAMSGGRSGLNSALCQ